MEFKCSVCGLSVEQNEVKKVLDWLYAAPKCTTCGHGLKPIVMKSTPKQRTFDLEKVQYFTSKRLDILQKKAHDLGLETCIVHDELMIRGDATKVEFFKFSMDVFTLSQLLSLEVPVEFLEMLEDFPETILEMLRAGKSYNEVKTKTKIEDLTRVFYTKI